jgi:hypothetical protein
MIHELQRTDYEAIKRIHEASGLPENCLPDLENPLFILKEAVYDHRGNIAQAAFLKMTGEIYLLVDHNAENPEWRWDMLQKLAAFGLAKAHKHGIDDCTCWIPPEARWFERRVLALGFEKSPWPSYTARLK